MEYKGFPRPAFPHIGEIHRLTFPLLQCILELFFYFQMALQLCPRLFCPIQRHRKPTLVILIFHLVWEQRGQIVPILILEQRNHHKNNDAQNRNPY